MKKLIASICLTLSFLLPASGQPLISVSGIIVDEAHLVTVPFVSVSLIGSAYGTAGMENGFFSIVAHPGDTLLFSSLGYEPVFLVVPDTLSRFRWSTVIEMRRDTVMLEEAVIYPWPNVQGFRRAFLAYRPEAVQDPLGYMPPGIINKPDTFYPVKPTLMNPFSLIYENVVLEVIKRMPKKKKVRELPRFD